MARKNRAINLPAPYLKRVWLDGKGVADRDAYPFCLPFLDDDFELNSTAPITIIVGENGTGKSTLLEGIAALAGYDEAGGGKGYRPVDHAVRRSRRWAARCRWRCAPVGCRRSPTAGSSAPRASSPSRAISTKRRAKPLSGPPPDFLSHSHGEGFLRFFQERCQRQGIFIFDEPESALSPSRQIEFLKLLRAMERSGICQVIMATHAPLLMAYPGARLLQFTRGGLAEVRVEETEHFRTMRDFCADPNGFVDEVLAEDAEALGEE